MSTTSPYGLPYPEDNAFVIDGPSHVQALAEATDDLIAQVVFDRDQADTAEAAARAAAVAAEAAARAAADTSTNGRLQCGTGTYTVGGGVVTITFPQPFPIGTFPRVVPVSAGISATFRRTGGDNSYMSFTVRDENTGALLTNGTVVEIDWLAMVSA